MNKALFSSLDTTWNTPKDLFDRLNAEFHFDLDPAANAKSAKCENYYSIEDDGLSKSWGGTPFSVTRLMGEICRNGQKRAIRNHLSPAPLLSC